MPEFPGRLRSPRLAAAPSSPAVGELYYNTGDNTLYWWSGSAWTAAKDAGGGPPSGSAGGDLGGSYPDPTVVKASGAFTVTGALKFRRYSVGNLPTTGTDLELAIVEIASGCECLMMYASGASQWRLVGAGRPISTSGIPAASTASGWRKPSTTISLTFPYAGTWQVRIAASITSGAAEPQIGVGVSKTTDSGTATPSLGSASVSAYTTNARVAPVLQAEFATIAAANDAWDLRVFTGASIALTPLTSYIYAIPISIAGLV